MIQNKRLHTPQGELYTALIRDTFRLYGRLIHAGDRLSSQVGLTSARWQVLGELKSSSYPLTVPSLARNLGLQRQSVQRLVDVLVHEGFVRLEENPHHRRAKLVVLTDRGGEVFDELAVFQAEWANEVAEGLDVETFKKALQLIQTLRARLGD